MNQFAAKVGILKEPSLLETAANPVSEIFRKSRRLAAFTLLEIAMVLLCIGFLAAALVFAYRGAAGQTAISTCVTNMYNIQQAVRFVANANQIKAGSDLPSAQIFGAGEYIDKEPVCPLGTNYTFTGTVPAVGEAYASCTQTGHVPPASQLAYW